MAKKSKRKTGSRKKRRAVAIRLDKLTGFTIVNGTTLVCAVNGGSPLSANR